ncbi:MAG: phosphoribosyltransferase [Prevotellaceae bacterium]|jgi:hypoxanthine phosphoribosyltransferase|nr:phosphoribosyltransferase [Prevotellaceae bacterium]
MKVIDLTNADIEKACELLISRFDCQFDLIVGIAEGGRLIAETIAQKLYLPLLLVGRQRELTRYKSKARNMFKHFPKKILNFARITENNCYEMLGKMRKHEEKLDKINILSNDLSFFENPQIKNILLVDDAIDSGVTIRDTEKFLQMKNNNWNIKTAVLTQTFNRPVKKADYQIYNRTLVRFPWSNDYKQ